MSEKYNPAKIEPKWQKIWAGTGSFKTPDQVSPKEKKYVLDMFPYPSGDGLHVGHVESYTASDIVARFSRMQGKKVLHPMGWDAFGLPAENYALKTGVHPRITTARNTKNFKKQLQSLGFSYDWEREINTTDPEYYKWTQWIFLQLFKQGLAYEAQVAINWCPSCKTGLANEEVLEGECERCGSIVGKKNLRQWLLRITQYADALLEGLDDLDWPERIKEMQRNWIGRSEGVEVIFEIADSNKRLTVYTTRPDTLFGATYLVLAPEHELLNSLTAKSQQDRVLAYVEQAKKHSDLERTSAKTKTGVFTGTYVINPVNKEKIPIWVADYVLADYGTGAVMAVPAHDDRDFAFAKKNKIPIKLVIESDAAGTPRQDDFDQVVKNAFTGEGRLVNSGQFSNLTSKQARKKITTWLIKNKLGQAATHYKLRDWVFSRQRYWGEPIPIIHCKKCGAVPVPEEDLPVKLPEVKKYEPTGTGESPLAGISEWANTKCPQCQGPAKRETNTMPQWAGSSWYFLRFADPHNQKEAWSKKALKKWLPVDFYIGGAEHAVLHLLYARFWVRALKDAGKLDFDEPFLSLRNQGIILAADGRKMSKSFGNVINPDELIKLYGADALRLFEMFLGPLEQEKKWSTKGITGQVRFLEKVWRLQERLNKQVKISSDLRLAAEKVTEKVTEDFEKLSFNTAISSLMEFTNLLLKQKDISQEIFERLLLLLSPMSPHVSEELWQRIGHAKSIFEEFWPRAQKSILEQEKVTLVVQVNGKFRGKLEMIRDVTQSAVVKKSKELDGVKKALGDKKISKTIFVKNRAINFVAN